MRDIVETVKAIRLGLSGALVGVAIIGIAVGIFGSSPTVSSELLAAVGGFAVIIIIMIIIANTKPHDVL